MSQLDSIGIAKQSAFGTKQTTAEYYLDAEAATYDGKPEFLDTATTVGYVFPQRLDVGTVTHKVTLDLIPRVASFPRILSMYFGAPTTTTVDTTGKKHAFSATGATPIYHSVRLSRNDPASDIIDLPFDLLGSKLTVMGSVNDYIKAKCELVGASVDASLSAPTVTLDSTERLMWWSSKLQANVDGGGDAEVKINSFEWEYDTALEDDHFIMGATGMAALPFGSNQSSTLKFTMTEESASSFVTWYRRALATSSRSSIAFTLDATNGTTLVGAATQHAGFQMKSYNAEIIDAPADIDAKSRLRQIEITARLAYDTSSSKFITVDAFNAVASY